MRYALVNQLQQPVNLPIIHNPPHIARFSIYIYNGCIRHSVYYNESGVIVLKRTSYHDISIGQGSASLLGSKVRIFLYVVDGLLFDTGPRSLARHSSEFFQNNVIEQVALTHVHEDHSGMAAWLQDSKKIPVYLHKDSLAYAEKQGAYPLYRRIMWGKRTSFQAEAVPQQLSAGKYSFNVIDAPGHSAAHNVFHEKDQGWLFTGDLYLGTKQLVAFYEEDMSQTIASIEMILQLDFDTVFCAHSGVWQDGKKLFQQKLEFLKELQAKVNEMKGQRFNTKQIDAILFPKKQPITYISRGEWSSLNMVRTL